MLDNKRGQIGETMTWVVATLVIIVILSISVFFAIPLGESKEVSIQDKEKDFIATKSITNFLSKKENVGLLTNKNYDILKTKLKSLSAVISPYNLEYLVKPGDVAHSGAGAWGIELKEDGEQKIRIRCNEILSGGLAAPLLLTTNVFLGDLKLNFGVDECFK